MNELLEIACGLLERDQDFVLARITNRRGSAPRTAGARMIVARDGTSHGTIGGGLLEARAMENSQGVFNDGISRMLVFDLSDDDISAMDMICGGSVEVLLDYFRATDRNRELFACWRKICAERRQALFVTAVRENAGAIERIGHCLLGAGDMVCGHNPLSDRSLKVVMQAWANQTAKENAMMTMVVEETTVIVEPVLKFKTVYIFGAGHVARPTAQMAAMVAFRVAVLDDRKAFANARRFPGADEIHVLADFDHALDGLSIDADSYIVILTRGHLHDKTVLAQALQSKAGYIGMIGSRRKRDAIYDALSREGFGDDDLERVYSPIGLSIGADTPEEIALSIVAELVRHRANAPFRSF